MPRTLSANLTQAKNLLESTAPWVWLVQVDIPGAPVPLRLANNSDDVSFQGATYSATPISIPSSEANEAAKLTRLTAIIENVSRNFISQLELYWVGQNDPDWTVRMWLVDASQPDEMPFGNADKFRVMSVSTTLVDAQVELLARGISSTATLPKRRFTPSGGFSALR